eukprot:2033790-Prorocentrum_lima.AAC.1
MVWLLERALCHEESFATLKASRRSALLNSRCLTHPSVWHCFPSLLWTTKGGRSQERGGLG